MERIPAHRTSKQLRPLVFNHFEIKGVIIMKTNHILEAMKERILAWAHANDDIRMVILVGSRARSEHPGSEYSDLDLFVFTDQYESYLSNQRWIENFGTVLLAETGKTAGNDPELMVVYEGFQGIDFVFIPAHVIKEIHHARELPEIFVRGFEIWIDKEEVSALLTRLVEDQKLQILKPKQPSQEEFSRAIKSFLFSAYYVGRILYQNDLWLAKARQNDLNYRVLQMLEWHARSQHNWSLDVWHMGKYMETWAEKTILERIPKIYSGYAIEQSQIALKECANLFEMMAHEVAVACNYSLDDTIFEKTKAFLDKTRNLAMLQ
jgi:aminoglycoside 6-adenylyltransferase